MHATFDETLTGKNEATAAGNQKKQTQLPTSDRYAAPFFYVATAGSFAAGASDMVDNAVASALGNFGILLILYRLYVLGPLLVARSSLGNDRWVDAEAQWVEDNYPWLDTVGKAGWGLLVVGVVLQMFLGIA